MTGLNGSGKTILQTLRSRHYVEHHNTSRSYSYEHPPGARIVVASVFRG